MPICGICRRVLPVGSTFCPMDGFRLQGAERADPLLGQLVGGRYRLDRLIGQGGMGQVYAALHVALDRTFAVKLLHAELDADPVSVKRFLREAQIASRVVHPNVVAITDFGRSDDGRYYLVMEHLSGETTADRLQRDGRFEPARALELLVQLGHALQAAHAQGVVHRDLKPANLMLVEGPRGTTLKVLDFGLARMIDVSGQTLTAQGEFLGTPGYVAPEQIRRERVDERTDLYALGCIGYALLTGSPPFTGPLARVLEAHLTVEPRPLPALEGAAGIGEVLARCLRKDPAGRFAGASELVTELERVAGAPPPRRRTVPPAALDTMPARRLRTERPSSPPEAREDTRPGVGEEGLSVSTALDEAHADLRRRWQKKLIEVAALHGGGAGFGFGEVARQLIKVQHAEALLADEETQIALLGAEIDDHEDAASQRSLRVLQALKDLRMQRSVAVELREALRKGDRSALRVWLGSSAHPAAAEPGFEAAIAEVDRTLGALDAQLTEMEQQLLELDRGREGALAGRRADLRTHQDRAAELRGRLDLLLEQLRQALDSDESSSPSAEYTAARRGLGELEEQIAFFASRRG